MEKRGLLKTIDQFLMRLSMREKWVLGGGGILAFVIIVYFTQVDPTIERMAQLDRLIPRKEQSLNEMMQLKGEYLDLSEKIQRLENRLPAETSFSALSFIEENAAKNGVRSHITFIRPLTPKLNKPYREIPVEVKLENVSLSQIIPFLTAIEMAPQQLRIKRLAMKTRFADQDKMDVTFLVLSYEKLPS